MRKTACLAALLLALSLQAFPQAAAGRGGPAAAKPQPARLESGPESVKGLPFFGQNAIAALAGRYSVGEDPVRVYCCRGEVFFGPEWSPLPASDSAGLPAGLRCLVRDREANPVLALRAARYTLFIELPRYSQALLRFSFAFADKFAPFFSNADTDAELSFPAFIDF
jgi:hypothetical protein